MRRPEVTKSIGKPVIVDEHVRGKYIATVDRVVPFTEEEQRHYSYKKGFNVDVKVVAVREYPLPGCSDTPTAAVEGRWASIDPYPYDTQLKVNPQFIEPLYEKVVPDYEESVKQSARDLLNDLLLLAEAWDRDDAMSSREQEMRREYKTESNLQRAIRAMHELCREYFPDEYEDDPLFHQIHISIGARLRVARERSGLTFDYINSQVHYRLKEYESDKRDPGSFVLITLSELYDTPIDWLLRGKPFEPGDVRFQQQILQSWADRAEKAERELAEIKNTIKRLHSLAGLH